MIDPLDEIEDLAASGGRLAGSDAERRAAGHLARRLEDLGREATVEPILIWPRYPISHLIHALLAIVGSALSVNAPLPGLILVAVAAIGTIGDITARLPVTRRLTGRRASQNVTSPEDNRRPGTLVLTAHVDSSKGGAAFGPTDARRRALGKLLRRPIGPAEPFAWSLLLLLACAIARMAGLESPVLSAVQFVPTVLLIVSVPYLADIALSTPVPGANDNASGAATVLRLAERYGGTLDHLDVWVAFTGAQEPGAQGMRAWLKHHKRDLDPLTTVVLNVDEVGAGTVRYAVKEGPLLALKQHPRLVALCDQIADEDIGRNRYSARPLVDRRPSDGYAARARGLPAITISCAPAPHHHQPADTPESVDEDALDRAFGFCSELVELIDEVLGPAIAETAGHETAKSGTS